MRTVLYGLMGLLCVLGAAFGQTVGSGGIHYGGGTSSGQIISSDVWYADARGLVGDGTTDNSAALTTLLQTVSTAGGGVIEFGVGTYKFASQIVIPNQQHTTPAPRSPYQYGIVLRGQGLNGYGGIFAADGSTLPTTNGPTVLSFTSAPASGRILTKGMGVLKVQDLVMSAESASASAPFILTTCTTVQVDNVGVWGKTGGVNAADDFLVCGGTHASLVTGWDNDENDSFQGYGTYIRGSIFHKVRRVIYGRVYANGLSVHNNWIAHGCGGSSCIELDNLGTETCAGANITNNVFETNVYTDVIRLTGAVGTTIQGNGMFDASSTTKSFVRFGPFSNYNLYVPGFTHDQTKIVCSDISTTGATYTASTRTISSSGRFAKYTYTAGDVLVVTGGVDAGDHSLVGSWAIASKTDGSAIVLTDEISGDLQDSKTPHLTMYILPQTRIMEAVTNTVLNSMPSTAGTYGTYSNFAQHVRFNNPSAQSVTMAGGYSPSVEYWTSNGTQTSTYWQRNYGSKLTFQLSYGGGATESVLSVNRWGATDQGILFEVATGRIRANTNLNVDSGASGGDLRFGDANDKVGFFGTYSAVQQAALSPASDASTVDGTYGAEEQAVIGNLRSRLNDLETKLKAYGLLNTP